MKYQISQFDTLEMIKDGCKEVFLCPFRNKTKLRPYNWQYKVIDYNSESLKIEQALACGPDCPFFSLNKQTNTVKFFCASGMELLLDQDIY